MAVNLFLIIFYISVFILLMSLGVIIILSINKYIENSIDLLIIISKRKIKEDYLLKRLVVNYICLMLD